MTINRLDLARHIDRVRRRGAASREGVVVRDVPGGWLSVQVGGTPAEFASQSRSRVNWLASEGPVTESAVVEALNAARDLGGPRLFVWLAPWGCDDDTDAALRRAGAVQETDVEQIALAREAGAPVHEPEQAFEVRALAPGEAAAVMEAVRPWYGTEGAARAARIADPGVEIFGAFEGSSPVAVGLLIPDGEWAYLGGAGTDPEKRGRGAQTALIRARVRRAAELGARRCACETNNAVSISLRNLRRCGFEDVLVWRVYRWGASVRP